MVKKFYQPDTVMKDFWRKQPNFNDICNGFIFSGNRVIQKAIELDTEEGTTSEVGSIQRRRDLLKRVNIDGDDVIIGIENQQYQDKTMPFRDMEYTSLKYGIRLKDATQEILPIITLVMFYGCMKWEYETELEKMVKVPEKIKDYFNNWKTIVIDAKEVDYEVFQTKEVRDFFAGLQSLYSWDKDISHLKDLELTYDTAIAIGVVTGTSALIEKAEKSKGGMVHMCQAVDEALQESKLQGIQEGKKVGIEEGKLDGQRQMLLQLLMKKFGHLSNHMIKIITTCTAENIRILTASLFDVESEEDILNFIH